MSGRIWVVEINSGTLTMPKWSAATYRATRASARFAQAAWDGLNRKTRVVQYVRQGGAK